MKYKVRMECHDSNLNVKSYIDIPAGDPTFTTKEAAFKYARNLAEEELEYFNEEVFEADEGVSFGIPEDDAYQNGEKVRLNQYFNPPGDFEGETNPITVYCVVPQANESTLKAMCRLYAEIGRELSLEDIKNNWLTENDTRDGKPTLWFYDGEICKAIYIETLEFLTKEEIDSQLC